MKEHLYYKFNASPVVLAFLNGVLISAGINLLTGLTTADTILQIIFSSISASSFIVAAVLMIIWQNKSSIVQDKYKKWRDCIDKNKEVAGEVTGINDKNDWDTFLNGCCSYDIYKVDTNKVGTYKLIYEYSPLKYDGTTAVKETGERTVIVYENDGPGVTMTYENKISTTSYVVSCSSV